MPLKVNHPTKTPVHYGIATGFNWVHNPFKDPLERETNSEKRERAHKKRRNKD